MTTLANMLAAAQRLLNYYNGDEKTAQNPGGLTGVGGMADNWDPCIQDIGTVANGVGSALTAASTSEGNAAASATAAAGSAQSAQQDAQATAADRQAVAQDRTGVEGSASAAAGSATLAGQYANAAGGSIPSVRLTWDTATADADPGNGKVRANAAMPCAATALYVDNVDAAGTSITTVLDRWTASTNTIKGTLRIAHRTDASMWLEYQVTGTVVDGTGYRKIAVTGGTGPGGFAAGDPVAAGFSRAGDAGVTPNSFAPGSATAPGLAVTGDADTGIAQVGGANTLSLVGGAKELVRFILSGLIVNPGRSIAQPTVVIQGPNETEDYIIQRKGDTGLLEVGGVQIGYSGFSFKVNNGVERLRIPNSGPLLVDGVPMGAGGLYSGTSTKAANGPIVAGDGGGVIKCTAAVTLTLPAASDLPAGWWVTLSNRVAGTVIFAPTGADTIAGVAAGWALRSGQDVTVYRSGAGSFELANLGQSLLDSQATWSPVNKGSGVTLSNNNFTAICPLGNSVRASAGASAGKRYYEILFNSVGAAGFGVTTAVATLNGVPGADANGWAYLGDGRKYTGNVGTAYGSTYTGGAVGRVAHDIDAGKVWVAIGSVWQGGGDPAAGTNPMFTGVSGGTFYPAVGDYNSSTTATGRFSTSSFSFTPPAGFLPYY